MLGLGITLPERAVQGARGSGPVPASPPKVLIEGDSITASSGSLPTYADRFIADHPTLNITNAAVGGSSINGGGGYGLYDRKAAGLALNPTHLTVHIGANDMMSYASAAAFVTALWGYTDDFRATGCKVAVGTVLPRTGQSGQLARRAEVNALIRAAVGTRIDAVFDFDTCPMGVDGAENDAARYYDGLHPSSVGQGLLKTVHTPVLRWMLGLANEVQGFVFDAVNAAVADTDYDSAPYTVKGLGAGEGKPYAVGSGVRVSRNGGAFTLDGSGTVVNGDTLRLRNRSSAGPATQTDVACTIGATSAIFSVTTAGAGARDWVPTDLGSKLKLWVRPEDIAGADGSQMLTWPDASGNGIALTGFGNGSRPTVVAGGLNGYRTVRFDSSYGQAHFDFPANYLAGRTTSASLFVAKLVADPPASQFGPPLYGWGSNTEGDLYPYSNGAVYSSYSSATRHQVPDFAPSLAAWRFCSFHAATDDWRYYVDGTAMLALTSNTFATGPYPNLGYDYQGGQMEGQIAEVVDCTSALTTTERQLVEGYLAWKYGLQANLPAGHPYESEKPTI